MKTILILCMAGLFTFLTACIDKLGGAGNDQYYIYITGDSSKIVEVSYLDWPGGDNNVIVTESVSLPFFKVAYTIDWGKGTDEFLEICTENDSTTRAIIFDDVQLADECYVMQVFLPENAGGDCLYTKDLPKDSVMNYLKSINYPCYMEFGKNDSCKKVRLNDWKFQ